MRKGDGGKFSLLRKGDEPYYPNINSENFSPSPFLGLKFEW